MATLAASRTSNTGSDLASRDNVARARVPPISAKRLQVLIRTLASAQVNREMAELSAAGPIARKTPNMAWSGA